MSVCAAWRLQENEEGLRAGVPFIEREGALRLSGVRDTADVVDELRTCELRGERLSTNGNIIFVGDPPSGNEMKCARRRLRSSQCGLRCPLRRILLTSTQRRFAVGSSSITFDVSVKLQFRELRKM